MGLITYITKIILYYTGYEKKKRIYNVLIKRLPKEELEYKKNNIICTSTPIPEFLDLRSKFPECYDQEDIGSCTGCAIVGAYQFVNPKYRGSILFQYYNERLIEHTTSADSGATVADGMRSLKLYGLCLDTEWPYTKDFSKKPSKACYLAAAKHKAINVYNVRQDIHSMKLNLPFVIGIKVYESFESDKTQKTGIIPMPDTKKEELMGGHCIVVCGYDDNTKNWTCRNSWGNKWGDNGYFYLPYEYITSHHLSSDIWKIETTDK